MCSEIYSIILLIGYPLYFSNSIIVGTRTSFTEFSEATSCISNSITGTTNTLTQRACNATQ